MSKLFLFLFIFVTAISCNKTPEDPLILPPKFNEEPNLNKLDDSIKKTNSEDVEKLKNLLLKSEE